MSGFLEPLINRIFSDGRRMSARQREASQWLGLESLEARQLLSVAQPDSPSDVTEVTATPGEVTARHIFYNESAFDGNDEQANVGDDEAIAPAPAALVRDGFDLETSNRRGKRALLPGQRASFQNYTSYSRGINGIMVDLVLAGDPDELTVDVFEFRVGNHDNPESWTTAPEPQEITVRPRDGVNGSDRITVVWDHNTIENQWLQVVVRATEMTGLTHDDVFYWGNAIGETGNLPDDTNVDISDIFGGREHHVVSNDDPSSGQATIDDLFDFDRDGQYGFKDEIVAIRNWYELVNSLVLFTPPVVNQETVEPPDLSANLRDLLERSDEEDDDRLDLSNNHVAALPNLPIEYVDTTYALPSGGTTWAVSAQDDFQEVLDAAQPGDIIELEAGAVFIGNFRLPNKTGDEWIYVRSSAYDTLPPEGTRVTPSDMHPMPKIFSPNLRPAIQADFGAHHYRFVGLEVSTTHSNVLATNWNVVLLGWQDDKAATSVEQLPHHIVFDRSYIHGTKTGNVRTGIGLNGNHVAVIDSYLSDFHEIGVDSQAIMTWNGLGPIKIVNNYLEGAGENVLIGGADPAIPNLVPSDIEIRNNHFFKPFSWKIGHPEYAGIPWTVKNLFELKNARRVLVDGNIFENNWAHAQKGFGILFTVRNQSGAAPWSVIEDVVFSNNIVRRVASGMLVTGADDIHPSGQTKRILIRNNLMYDVNRTAFGGGGTILQISTGEPAKPILDLTVEHNTAIHADGGLAFVTAIGHETAAVRFVFRNNLVTHGAYGFRGQGRGVGIIPMDHFLRDYIFQKNVLIGAIRNQPHIYPDGNFHPETVEMADFADYASQDFRLTADSPYRNAGTDGTDIGVDFDTLDVAISDVLAGGVDRNVVERSAHYSSIQIQRGDRANSN